jgi:hypothetical protein
MSAFVKASACSLLDNPIVNAGKSSIYIYLMIMVLFQLLMAMKLSIVIMLILVWLLLHQRLIFIRMRKTRIIKREFLV